MTWISELVKAIKDLIPTLAAFFLGKQVGDGKRQELESKKRTLELEIERFRIQEKIRIANSKRSDSDVIDDAVKGGNEMLIKRGSKGDEDVH